MILKTNRLAFAGMLIAICPFTANAQSIHEDHGHQHVLPAIAAPQRGPHGGSLKAAGKLQLETVVSQGGIELFVFDSNGRPISVERGRGIASLRFEGNAKRYRYDLLPDGKGGLTAPVNLSKREGRQIEVDVQVFGLPGNGSRPLRFTEVASVPASQQQLAAAAIARQKICPVSGKLLGSMGQSVKVLVGDEPIFLCCKGCIKRVQAEPAIYLAIVDGSNPQNDITASEEQVRPGVYNVGADDASFVAAQKMCPVMDEPLDAMGGPYKVNADGKAIYICCPGCAKKIAAEPQKYLTILARQGVNPPVMR